MQLDLKIFRMNRFYVPQELITGRLGVDQKTIHNLLGKKVELPILLKANLSKGFTVSQVSVKHGLPEPIVWSVALEEKNNF